MRENRKTAHTSKYAYVCVCVDTHKFAHQTRPVRGFRTHCASFTPPHPPFSVQCAARRVASAAVAATVAHAAPECAFELVFIVRKSGISACIPKHTCIHMHTHTLTTEDTQSHSATIAAAAAAAGAAGAASAARRFFVIIARVDEIHKLKFCTNTNTRLVRMYTQTHTHTRPGSVLNATTYTHTSIHILTY